MKRNELFEGPAIEPTSLKGMQRRIDALTAALEGYRDFDIAMHEQQIDFEMEPCVIRTQVGATYDQRCSHCARVDDLLTQEEGTKRVDA